MKIRLIVAVLAVLFCAGAVSHDPRDREVATLTRLAYQMDNAADNVTATSTIIFEQRDRFLGEAEGLRKAAEMIRLEIEIRQQEIDKSRLLSSAREPGTASSAPRR